MFIRVLISSLTIGFLLLMVLFINPGCANIIPPEGGPRDSLPPNLVRVVPTDSTLNFQGNRITFTFDEYIELENYTQNLIVSPVPNNMPNVTRKLQTISVKLRDSLERNTTYTLNFGKSVKDVNEGNIAEDLTYVFSTGLYFDSLQLRGNVVLAESGEVDTSLTIMLHRTNRDSAVVKEKPRYIAKTDNKGNFLFRNLPPDTFYVYALQDQSGTYRYMNPTQLFGFKDSAVIMSQQPKPFTIYAYATKREERTSGDDPKTRKGAEKRLRVSTNLVGNEQDLLSKLTLNFETPLRSFDSSKLHFSKDTLYTPVTNYSWTPDSLRKVYTLNYTWEEGMEYHLIMEKDFATDTLNQQLLKADTITFNTRKLLSYGKLAIRFKNVDMTKNPVVQFVQNDEVKFSFPLAAANFSQALFTPGEYSLRILQDRNKNGKWDGGQFFKNRIQPEIVKPVQRKITIKENWDNQFDIDVNAAAPPPTIRNRPGQNPTPATPRRNPTTTNPRRTLSSGQIINQ